MIKRGLSACLRGMAVGLAVASPAILVPGTSADTSQIAVFVALILGGLVCAEYWGETPSFIEFRNAAPVNRLRFGAVVLALVLLAHLYTAGLAPRDGAPGLLPPFAALAALLDVPLSPVRLLASAAESELTLATRPVFVAMAGTAYLVSLALILGMALVIRLLDWPLNRGAFNVLTNLPMFDPTSGGDVLARMRRDGQINLSLGILLPFLLPTLLSSAPLRPLLGPQDALTLIWVLCAWAMLPAMMVLRGMALLRIAGLIEEKRRRAYAQRDANESLQLA